MLPDESVNAPSYKEVRGLSRGLHVLEALNRMPGGIASTTDIANACHIHRTTAKRLLETLRTEGFVRPGEREGQYYLTFEVRRLSEGFEDEAWVSKVATPLMKASVRDIVWPCDLATVEAGFMVVRESTHRWSGLSQHRAMIGEKLPLFVTALGRAYLAACSDTERRAVLGLLAERNDWIGVAARDAQAVKVMVKETRRRGYAINDGELLRDASFAAIAVPVLSGDRLLASVNMVFPRNSITPMDLKHRYAPKLQRLANSIGNESRPWIEL